MVDIANREQQYFVANRAFATEAELGYVVPTEVTDNYTCDVDPDTRPAADLHDHVHRRRAQAADGDLTLTSEGVKGPAGQVVADESHPAMHSTAPR